uniref:Uncharacterized protein n=1 Tax=Glossina austeni TaxID=7395 RepID=A0A1A9UTL8_GLOAU
MVTVIERSSDIICSNSVLLKRNKQESIAAATGFLCMNITCAFLCYVVWVALELIPSLILAATSDHTLIAFNFYNGAMKSFPRTGEWIFAFSFSFVLTPLMGPFED